MSTGMTRLMFGFDPICAHPWNPWLKQAFHSILLCLKPPFLKGSFCLCSEMLTPIGFVEEPHFS